MTTDFDSRGAVQGSVEGQRITYLRRNGSLTDALFYASTVHLGASWITEEQANLRSVLGFPTQALDQGWIIGQEHPRIQQDLNMVLGLAEQAAPQLGGYRVPMWIDLHNLRTADLGSPLWSDRVRPEIVLRLAHHRRDGPAVLRVGQAPLGDPALHGLGIHAGGPRDLVQAEAVA